MANSVSVTLTGNTLSGLFFIQRYRFLTIKQFARVTGLYYTTAADTLRQFERAGLLGFFGNSRLAGNGKTPKAYYLTRKGWELLRDESDNSDDLVGEYKEVKIEARWAPQMYHRLATVDLLTALEVAVANRPRLSIIQTFLEYKRLKKGNQIVNETMDYVDSPETSENKIIPDAAYILENTQTSRRALFFIEVDMATERIISSQKTQTTIRRKYSQYDRYLKSFRYSQKYQTYGEFRAFSMLFVTLTQARIENIRRELSDLPDELARYYRLTTFDAAMEDFLGAIWQSRLLSDTTTYPLVQEEQSVSG